jgi:6-phosphogluconolactonase
MCADSRTSPGQWTRREFVRGAAGLVVAPHLPAGLHRAQQFAYLACGGQGSIHVFSSRGKEWTPIQQVTSRSPAFVLLSPAQRTLYVANEVDVHEGLPRGSVEAFSIDPGNGRLTLLGRTALSLSATRPRHMAISPDGRLLAVAAYGGGVYNLLPIEEDGALGQPHTIFKDAGCGAHSALQASAHPHTLVFDGAGRKLLSSDFGRDQLSVFSVRDSRLQRNMQRSTGDGSGPGACLLHPSAGALYVWHGLKSVLACYRYDGASVGEVRQQFSLPSFCEGSLALHPSGRMLYTTQSGLRAWRVDERSGMLALQQKLSIDERGQIVVARDGKSVYVLSGASGLIHELTADRATGALRGKTTVAMVDEPRSLALKTMS